MPVGKASAQFVIHNGTSEQPPISWQDGGVADIRLGQVFLFDSSCAEHYIRENDGTTFTPLGLDILDKLIRQLCDPIKGKIQERISKIEITCNAVKNNWNYKPDTPVGKLLNGLTVKTKITDIEAIAKWSDTDSIRLNELQAALASDPKIKSEQTQAAAVRIKKFRQSVAITRRALSESSIIFLRAKFDEAQQARIAAQELAAGKFDEPSFLSGTGGGIWKNLWNAAREYSVKAAYLDKEFPVIDNGSRCVLCQSELDTKAVMRLSKFDKYINDEASKLAAEKEAFVNALKQEISLLSKLAAEKNKIDADLTTCAPQEKSIIDAFVQIADTRLIYVLQALKNSDWVNVPSISRSPSRILRAIEKNLLQQAKTEAAAADPELRKNLISEKDQLIDRKWFSDSKSIVLQQIARYAAIARLNKSIKDTSTATITNKNKELTKKFVTEAFCKQFQMEIKELGLRTLKVKLHAIDGKKGITKFGVRLQEADNAAIAKIASEGERRCIALSLFLAELSQASHASTLVFDDPVSSLDHGHKEGTAKRLVKESLVRQVIVFTHDTVLLHELQTAAEQQNITPHTMYLEWNGGVPGHCVAGLPWDWKSAPDRFDKLEKEQRAIEKEWNPIPNEENKRTMREAYSWLRATFERMIENNIFAGTVVRFRNEVKVALLSKVVGFSQDEFDELERLYKRCCNVTEAHDPAQAKNAPIPTPQELASDIADGKKLLLETIPNRQKRMEQQKKIKTEKTTASAA